MPKKKEHKGLPKKFTAKDSVRNIKVLKNGTIHLTTPIKGEDFIRRLMKKPKKKLSKRAAAKKAESRTRPFWSPVIAAGVTQ